MFDKEPEDIFSDTLPAKTETLRPQGAVSPTVPGRPGAITPVGAKIEASPEEMDEGGGGGKKKLFLVLTAVVLLAILSVGGYLAWQQFGKGGGVTVEEGTNTPAVNVSSEGLTNIPVVTPEPESEVPTTPVVLPTADTDGDGLTDAEETTLGTDPAKSDTDLDNLNDREETQIYRTNPLNPDTDGDTFLDGSEVQNGYNPNGPGKLFELP
jgi:hypothetical protein